MLRVLVAFFGLCLLSTGSAAADACVEEIRAIYLSGFERPPYRSVKVVTSDGARVEFTNIVQDIGRTISSVNGGAATLAIGETFWTGPGIEGPWTVSQSNRGPDWKEKALESGRQYATNMTDAQCLGEFYLDGQERMLYRFTSHTDKDQQFWYGATHDLYVDPASGRVMQEEQTNFDNSFKPDPDGHSVERFAYDSSIEIPRPE